MAKKPRSTRTAHLLLEFRGRQLCRCRISHSAKDLLHRPSIVLFFGLALASKARRRQTTSLCDIKLQLTLDDKWVSIKLGKLIFRSIFNRNSYTSRATCWSFKSFSQARDFQDCKRTSIPGYRTAFGQWKSSHFNISKQEGVSKISLHCWSQDCDGPLGKGAAVKRIIFPLLGLTWQSRTVFGV